MTVDVGRLTSIWGCTAFERDVIAALAAVPYGHASSYRDVAVAAGYPNAYRAVGSVMARNPLPVILPCHRVIRNDGRLGAYGDDPRWKARLLALEGYTVWRTIDEEV
jgi:methylated-DNA-[protein]-cysteine S-methyltransferase